MLWRKVGRVRWLQITEVIYSRVRSRKSSLGRWQLSEEQNEVKEWLIRIPGGKGSPQVKVRFTFPKKGKASWFHLGILHGPIHTTIAGLLRKEALGSGKREDFPENTWFKTEVCHSQLVLVLANHYHVWPPIFSFAKWGDLSRWIVMRFIWGNVHKSLLLHHTLQTFNKY